MNWVEIIGELTAAGYSQTDLADACKCAQSTISDIANGVNKDPRTSIADALRGLLEKPKKRQRKQKVGA